MGWGLLELEEDWADTKIPIFTVEYELYVASVCSPAQDNDGAIVL